MGLLITILLCLINIFNVISNNSPSVKVSLIITFVFNNSCAQGVIALSMWVLTCIMFVFSAGMAYTAILSKSIITFINIRYYVIVFLAVKAALCVVFWFIMSLKLLYVAWLLAHPQPHKSVSG